MRKKLLPFLCLLAAAGCLPPAPPYPEKSPAEILAEGQYWSDRLDQYIDAWLAGTAPAAIPDSIIPPGITDSKNFYLAHPDSVAGPEAWAWRVAKPVDFDSLHTAIPDPHVTYLFLGTALAPFGHKLVIEGDFPHARFFSIQITPPLNGREYYAQRVYGAAEVSLVDADIEPLPGHVNPYRPGADRTAPNRRYRATFDLAAGDPVALNNGAFAHPYRAADPNLTGALLVYQGPWGKKNFLNQTIPGGGDWNLGGVWLRIYAPDADKGPFGGVALPKVWMETPEGQRYFIGSDFTALMQRANQTFPAPVRNPAPHPSHHAGAGWGKSFGILRSMLLGSCQYNGWLHPDSLERVRQIDLGVTGRGEFQPAPGNYEPHATTNNYATYLGRSLTVPEGYVGVLVGRMPTFPDTRNGAPTMQPAEVRYWSVCGYDYDALSASPSACFHSVMDDDVTLDAARNYVIAYSRAADRPTNATAAHGVTWVNWGPAADQGLLLRWVSVDPDWSSDKSPNEVHLTWAATDLAGSGYDSTLIGENWHRGWMGCLLPRVVLLTKAEFEALGASVSATNFPVWVDEVPRLSANEARLQPATASSVGDANTTADRAVDRNLATYWAPAWGFVERWLTVDLGSSKSISGAKLFWGFGAATQYRLEVSDDGQSFTPIFVENNGNGGQDAIRFLSATGRYVRVHVVTTNFGWCELREFEVYSADMPCSPSVSAPTPVSAKASRLALRCWPNPATDWLHVSGYGAACTLRLLDARGAEVRRVATTGDTTRLPVHNLPAGVYWVEGGNGGAVRVVVD